jgi:hypothetical protein
MALGELLGHVHAAVMSELKHLETRKALRGLFHDRDYVNEYAEGEASLSLSITNVATKDTFLVNTIVTECDNATAILKLGRMTFTMGQGTVQWENVMLRLNSTDDRTLTATGGAAGRMRLLLVGKIIETPISVSAH